MNYGAETDLKICLLLNIKNGYINNKMKQIDLRNLQLKTFTLQNALDYCSINNLNPNNITELNN